MKRNTNQVLNHKPDYLVTFCKALFYTTANMHMNNINQGFSLCYLDSFEIEKSVRLIFRGSAPWRRSDFNSYLQDALFRSTRSQENFKHVSPRPAPTYGEAWVDIQPGPHPPGTPHVGGRACQSFNKHVAALDLRPYIEGTIVALLAS